LAPVSLPTLIDIETNAFVIHYVSRLHECSQSHSSGGTTEQLWKAGELAAVNIAMSTWAGQREGRCSWQRDMGEEAQRHCSAYAHAAFDAAVRCAEGVEACRTVSMEPGEVAVHQGAERSELLRLLQLLLSRQALAAMLLSKLRSHVSTGKQPLLHTAPCTETVLSVVALMRLSTL